MKDLESINKWPDKWWTNNTYCLDKSQDIVFNAGVIGTI